MLHNRNNRYTRGGQAIPADNNARIYRLIKELSAGEVRIIDETRRFLDSSIKIKNALAQFKKKSGIKCEKLRGFIAEYWHIFKNKAHDCTGQSLRNVFQSL